MPLDGPARWWRAATLAELRALVRPPRYRRLWFLVSVAYVLVSLFLGQMLLLFVQPTSLPDQVIFLTNTGQVANAYLLPGVIATGPNFVLTLSLWPTLAMCALGAGIGLSVAAAVALFVGLRRGRADLAAGGAAPAVTGWALLGACCCSSCAAQFAAVGILGAAVGSSPSTLLGLSWPIAVVQLVVVGLSLLYLERTLTQPAAACELRPASRPRRAIGLLLRLGLLVGGLTWLFALLVEALTGPAVSAGLVYHWTVEHLLLGGIAVATALAPLVVWRGFARAGRLAVPLRVGLGVGALTWGLWVPPEAVGWGLGGMLNELLGVVGAPASWGAVPPDTPLGLALLFHWAFQHALLAGWAFALAVRPTAALAVVSPTSRPAAATPPTGVARPAAGSNDGIASP